MELEHAVAVQPQQGVELGRHGVQLGLHLPVVVVVVCQFVEVERVRAEGPEAVEVHVGAQLQRQARHDDARAEAHLFEALAAPEGGQVLEVIRVEEDGLGGAPEVLHGVGGAQGHGSVGGEGEGGDEDEGVAVGPEALDEGTAAPHQSAEPGESHRP